VFIDRGSTSGIERGMAVVTPDGVVGKVIAVYPLAAQVLLVTDPTFAVGIESQKGHVHGTLHCNGASCTVEFIQNEESVQRGEWFYTSGEDRIFPKGFPVGTVSSVKPGQFMKEIHLNLSGAPGSADEVLVVIEGVHQQIPTTVPPQRMVKNLPPPPDDDAGGQQSPRLATEADKIKQRYQQLGKEQNHQFGAVGSNMPNFNQRPPASEQPENAGAGTPGAVKAAPDEKPAQAQESPKTAPAPRPPATIPSGPPVLGARPQPRPETPVARPPAPSVTQPSGPPLPLGAPRKKATPAERVNSPQP
jgi:rod shape-determining protein MreC